MYATSETIELFIKETKDMLKEVLSRICYLEEKIGISTAQNIEEEEDEEYQYYGIGI